MNLVYEDPNGPVDLSTSYDKVFKLQFLGCPNQIVGVLTPKATDAHLKLIEISDKWTNHPSHNTNQILEIQVSISKSLSNVST